MREISDDIWIEEINKRFLESRKALHDLEIVTKKLEMVNEKLRQAEALRSDFLSNIRNEINNPLAAILGMSKQLAEGVPDRETAALMAEAIHQEAFELDFQLKNIFIAAEIEAGESSLSVSRTDLAALVHGLIASFHHKAAEKNIRVNFEYDPSGPGELSLTTDPEKISCILSNLLANAIEYSDAGKTVYLRARKDGRRLTVAVADEGIGIAEQDREKIFDRFLQLDAGAKKRHKGHGLGLSITKALTEILDGEIALSCALGKGCAFTLAVDDACDGQEPGERSGDGNEYFFEDARKF